MPIDDNVAERYAQADRPQCGALLSELAAVPGLLGKSLLRLLHAPCLERLLPNVPMERLPWATKASGSFETD